VSGSGRNIQELNKLLLQFNQMRNMMKTMNKMRSSGMPFNMGR
jgi:signal recognition particle GTPase